MLQNSQFLKDFVFRIALLPQPGADFAECNFKKRSETPIFSDFDFRMALSPQPGAVLWNTISKSAPKLPVFNDFDLLSGRSLVQILQHTISKSVPKLSVFNDFDLRIVLSPQPGVDFVEHGFKKRFKALSF